MELLERKSVTHFVIVDKTGNLCWYISSTSGFSQFPINGVDYIIGGQSAKIKVGDFKKKVIRSIDSAETKGGTYSEKFDRFLEIFGENDNLVVKKESEVVLYSSVSRVAFYGDEKRYNIHSVDLLNISILFKQKNITKF